LKRIDFYKRLVFFANLLEVFMSTTSLTSLTFKTLGKSLGIALAGLMLGQSAPVLAQSQAQAHTRFDNGHTGFTRPRSTDDLSRVNRLNGKPGQISQDFIPSCPSGQVLSGGACTSMQSASGATLLPGNVPSGSYTNRAGYPLVWTFIPAGHRCFGGDVYVDGRLVARYHSDCEGTYTSVQAIVPSGSTVSYSLGGATAMVTALANNAHWRDTAIRFVASGSAWSQKPGTADGIRAVYDQFGEFLTYEISACMYGCEQDNNWSYWYGGGL
jgi:hypothetical protein